MAKRKNSSVRPAELAQKLPDSTGGDPDSLGFALRLESGRALLDLRQRKLGEGIRLNHLEMEIPNVKFPFDVSGGAERFHSTHCLLRSLVLEFSLDTLRAQLERTSVRDAGFFELEAVPEAGALTVTGVYGDQHTLFSFAIAPVIMAPRELALLAFDERIYGRSNLPAQRIPWLLLQATSMLELNASEPVFDVVAMSVRELLPRFGWKIPDTSDVGIIQAEVSKTSWIVACGRSLLDEGKTSSRVSFAVEARAPFEDIERRVYKNEDDDAFAAFRAHVDEELPQRFAVRRYLQLAAAAEARQEEGRSVAEEALVHDEKNIDALLFLAQYGLYENEPKAAASYFARAAELLWADKSERAATLADVSSARIAKRIAPEAARFSLARALKKRKSDVRALRELFAIEKDAEQWKPASLAGEKLLRALPHDERYPIHLELGELLLDHDLKKAKLHAERALRAQMDSPAAIHLVAKVFARSGDVPRAVRYLAHLSEQYIALGDMPKATAIEVEIAEQLESTQNEAGFDKRALLGRYQRILTLDPGLRQAIRRTAQLAFELGETSAAKRWFDELIDDSDPDLRAEAAFRLAQLALREDREFDAEASFAASISGPFGEEAYKALKLIYERRNDRRSLYRLEKQLAARRTSDAEILEHHLRAAALAQQEQMGASCIQHLEAALQLVPNHHLVKRKLVDAIVAHRGPESVEGLLAGLAPQEHEPVFRAEWYLELATLRENKNELNGAKAALDAAIVADPSSVEANEALYALCQKLNESAGAFAALGNLARYRAASEESKAEIRITQAELLSGALNRRDEARAYLLRALIDVPHHVRGLKLLGELAEEAKDWAMATDAWTRYLETGAEDGRATALESLARLAAERGDTQAQFARLLQLWQLTGQARVFEEMQRVLKERGDFQRLVHLLRDAAAATDGDKAAALRFETALVLRDSVGDWAGARAELMPLVDAPTDWGKKARDMLVSLALDEGRQDLFAQALKRQIAFATDSEVPELKLQIARAYRESRDDAAAVATYRWLLEHDAQNDEALSYLAENAEQTGNAELAYQYQLMRLRLGNLDALPALVRVTEQVPATVLKGSIPHFDKVPPRFALEIAGRLDAEGYSEEAIAAIHRALQNIDVAAERAPHVFAIARIEESSMCLPQRALATLRKEHERYPDYAQWRVAMAALMERAGTPLQKGELQLERAYATGDVSLMWQAFEALLDVAPEHLKLGDVFDKVAMQPLLRAQVIAFLDKDSSSAIIGENKRAHVLSLLHAQSPLESPTLLVLARLLRRLDEHEGAQALWKELFERNPEDDAIFQQWRAGAKDGHELDAIDGRRIEVLARVYTNRNDFSALANLLAEGIERGLLPVSKRAQVRDLYERAGDIAEALHVSKKITEEAPTVIAHWLRRAELALLADAAAEVVHALDALSMVLPTLDSSEDVDMGALERRFAESLADKHPVQALHLVSLVANKGPTDDAAYRLLQTLLADNPTALLERARTRALASMDGERIPAIREWLRVAERADDHGAMFAAYRAIGDLDGILLSDVEAAVVLLDAHTERLPEVWEWSESLVPQLSLATRRKLAALAASIGEDDIRYTIAFGLPNDERSDDEVEYLCKRREASDHPDIALEHLRGIAFSRVVENKALRGLWLRLAAATVDTAALLQMREALAEHADADMAARIDFVVTLLDAHQDERAFALLETMTREDAFKDDPRAEELSKQFHHLLYDTARKLLATNAERALAYSQRLLREAPDSEEAWLLSVDAARTANTDDRLIALLESRPLSAELATELAQALTRTGRHTDAAASWIHAFDLSHDRKNLDAALVSLAASGDELALAQALVRYAAGAETRAMIERALSLYAKIGDASEVAALATRLFEDDPSDTAAYERYRDIVLAREDAIELSRVWKLRATRAEADERKTLALQLARLHIEKLFDHNLAESALSEIYPDPSERDTVLYGIYAEQHDENRAAQIARRLYERNPSDAAAYARLRAHVEATGGVIDLFELLESRIDALSIDARAPVALEAAHLALARLHDTDAAERALHNAFTDEFSFTERAIELYEAHGYADKEAELSKRLFALDPQNDEVYQRYRLAVEASSDVKALIDLLELRATALPENQGHNLALEAARLALDKAKDPERADAILARAFGPDSRDRAVLQLKIAVHLRTGNDAEALGLLKGLAATTDNPVDKASLLLQASLIAERIGMPQEAASTWALAMLNKASEEEIVRRDVFFPALDADTRAAVSEVILAMLPAQDQRAIELWLSAHYEAKAELSQALDYARRALARDPEDSAQRARVAALLEKLGETESLVQLLSEQHATQLDRGERYRIAIEVAERCERDMNDLDLAVHFYRQASKDDPTQALPWQELVRLYSARNATALRCEAAEALAERLPAGSERGTLCLQIGEWRSERGEFDNAALAYLHAFASGFSNPKARRSVRVATKRGQLVDEAIRELLHLAELQEGDERIDALKDAAEIAAEARQDYLTAVAIFRRALVLRPPSREDRMRLVEWLERSGQSMEAVRELLTQADLEERDDNRALLLRRAQTLADQSGNEDARLLVFELKTARALTTIDEQLSFAEQQNAAGRKAIALRIFEQALERASTTEARARIKAKLVELGLAELVFKSLLAVTGSDRGRAIAEAARLYETTGDAERAYALYREAFSARLDLPGADLARIAVLAEQHGDDQLLGEAYLRIAESDTDASTRASAYFAMAKLWLDRNGDAPRAEDALRLALKAQPKDEGAQRMLARLLVEQSRYGEAKQYLQALVPSADEADAPWLVLAAQALFELGDNDKARALLLPLAAKDETAFWSLLEIESRADNHQAVVRILLGRLRAQQAIADTKVLQRGAKHAALAGDGEAESTLLAALSDHGSADALTYARLAELALGRNDFDSGHRWMLRRADMLDSPAERAGALLEAGKLARRMGRMAEAQNELESAFNLQPEQMPILNELFEFYRASSDAEHLLVVGERMVIVDPNGKRPQSFYLALADAAEATRTEWPRVLEFYQLAAAASALNLAVLERAIYAAEHAGRDNERLEWEEERLTLVQGTADDYLRLGVIARDRLADVARAERYFRLAKSSDPNAHAPVYALAAILAPNKDSAEEAIALYKDLVTRQPLDLEPYRLLARLYGQAQDPDRTMMYYDALRALDPADEEAERFISAAQQVMPELPPRGVSKDELSAIADQGLLSPLQQFFGPLAANAELLYATDLSKFGLGESDAIPSKTIKGHRINLIKQRMGGRALEVLTYQASAQGNDAIIEPGAPAKLVLSADAFDMPGRGLQFITCRAFAFLSLGHLLPSRLQRSNMHTLLGLMLKRFVPNASVPNVPPDRAAFVIERFRTTTPDEVWLGHTEVARRFMKEVYNNPELMNAQLQAWITAGERTADRWALLMSGDMVQAFAYQRHSGDKRTPALPPHGPERLQAIAAREDLLRLLNFAVSDTYLNLRQAFGFSLRR